MKITRLDNFGEGFTVTPRRPHRETRTLGKPLTSAEKKMRMIDVCTARLEQDGACYVSCFRNRRGWLNVLWKINKAGTMNLEKVFDNQGLLVGYKVAKQ